MATAAVAERFDMGRALSRASGAIGRNIGLFAMLAVILQFVPGLLVRALTPTPVVPLTPGALPNFSAVAIVGGILGFVCTYVLQAAVTHVTVVDLRGERATLGSGLGRGVRMIVPLFLLGLAMGFGVGFGFLLLIVPGIMLAVAWSVSTPVMVEERTGVFASLSRSAALTKGSRWSIFLLALAIFIILVIVSSVVGLLAFSGSGFDPVKLAQGMSEPLGVAAIIGAVVNAATFTAAMVVIAAIYIELRYIRDGDRPSDIADIFA